MNEQNRPQDTPGVHMDPVEGHGPEGPALQPNGPKPAGGGKKIAVIAIAVVAVCAIVFGGVYALAFGNKIKDPEAYLAEAFANNERAKNTMEPQYPDFSKFSEKSHQVDLYVGSDLGFDVDFSYIMNVENQSFWAGLDLDVTGIAFNGNEVYFAKDLIGFKIPYLTPQYDFITIDPRTVVADWNQSTWASLSPLYVTQEEIDEAFDTAYEAAYDSTSIAETASMLADDIYNELESNRTIRGSAVKKDLTLNNQIYKTNQFVYIYPAASMQRALDNFMLGYGDVIDAWVDMISQSNNMSITDVDDFYDALSLLDDMFSNVTFPEDLLVHAYVDENQYVRQMSFEGLKIEYPEDGETRYSLIDFSFTLLGAQNPYEEYEINIYIHETIPTEIKIHGTKNNGTSGVTDETLTFVLSSSPDTLQLDYNYYWDEYETAAANFELGLKLQMNRDALSIGLEGILEDTSNAITISDGILTVGASGVRLPVNFSFGVTQVDNPAIDVQNRSNNISFFQLTPDDIMEMMYKLY